MTEESGQVETAAVGCSECGMPWKQYDFSLAVGVTEPWELCDHCGNTGTKSTIPVTLSREAVRQVVEAAVDAKDAEIAKLRRELSIAIEQRDFNDRLCTSIQRML